MSWVKAHVSFKGNKDAIELAKPAAQNEVTAILYHIEGPNMKPKKTTK